VATRYAQVVVDAPSASALDSGEFRHVGLQVDVDGDATYPIRVLLIRRTDTDLLWRVYKKTSDTGTAVVVTSGTVVGASFTLKIEDDGTGLNYYVDAVLKDTHAGLSFESDPYTPKLHCAQLHDGLYSYLFHWDNFEWSDDSQTPAVSWTDDFADGLLGDKWIDATWTAGYAGWTETGGQAQASVPDHPSITRGGNLETRFRAPSAPATLYVDSTDAQEGTENPVTIDLTPVFSAVYQHPDDDSCAQYQLQVSTDSAFVTATHWDSGWVNLSIADEGRSANIVYAGSALSNVTQYFWRIRWADDHGGYQSAWSALGPFFSTVEATVSARAALRPIAVREIETQFWAVGNLTADAQEVYVLCAAITDVANGIDLTLRVRSHGIANEEVSQTVTIRASQTVYRWPVNVKGDAVQAYLRYEGTNPPVVYSLGIQTDEVGVR